MPSLNPIPTDTKNNTQEIPLSNPRANLYNDPQGLRGTPVQSSVGKQQWESVFYTKKIMADVAKKRKFSKLATDSISMPKNMGMRIKAKIDLPVLDDRNVNDQGIDSRGLQIKNGNFYGSSRDIGRVLGSLPILTEEGGRVNRFGFSRAETEGTFNRYGIFVEYSRDLRDLDSDPNLVTDMHRKVLETAEQIAEDNLQADLLNSAGTVIYAGNAVSEETMNESSMVTFQALEQLSKALRLNRTPRKTKYVYGSTNYDTKTLHTHYVMFVGNEVYEILKVLKDNWGNPAFIPVEKYGASIDKVMEDEVGAISDFRIILTEDMMGWYGAGAEANPEFGLATQDGKYNIYPMLVVGDDAFSAITFNGSNGINNKFEIKHIKPEESHDIHDPYGMIGLISCQWFYGILVKRPERIALIKTVAPM